MKLYISGPMTGLPEFNFPAFNAAAEQLREAGFEVVNPADGGADDSKQWADYMRDDIRLLMDCDGVALLPDWSKSRGATLEVDIAIALDMPCAAPEIWVRRATRAAELVGELTT